MSDSSEGVTQRTSIFGSVFTYFREVVGEVKKVRWPNRKEMVSYTVTVVSVCVVLFLLTYGFDVLVTHGMQALGIANG